MKMQANVTVTGEPTHTFSFIQVIKFSVGIQNILKLVFFVSYSHQFTGKISFGIPATLCWPEHGQVKQENFISKINLAVNTKSTAQEEYQLTAGTNGLSWILLSFPGCALGFDS